MAAIPEKIAAPNGFVFDPSLVLYLPLYGLDGSSFMSKDAYGHLCTVAGATWTPQGRKFDGTDDYISVPDHSSLDITSAITVMAWARFNNIPLGNEIALNKEGAYRAIVSPEVDDDQPCFRVYIGGAWRNVIADTVLTTDTFYHIVGTYDGSYIRIYVNGVEDATPVSQSGNIATSANDLVIGDYVAGGGWNFAGCIGEVLIYNRALTLQEIQHHYLATKWRYR